MRLLRNVLAFLLVSLPAAAQFTQVTGTVIDPNGIPYANGTIAPFLVNNSGQSVTLNGFAYAPPTQPVGLDKSGKFLLNLPANGNLSPGSTQWNFWICSAIGTVNPSIGTGSQCFTLSSPITIAGAAQDITASISASALTLLTGGGGLLPPGVAKGSQFVSNGVSLPGVYQVKPVVDVRDYGLLGDGQLATDCSITSGAAVVTCSSSHFVPGDVGKSVGMWDAGPPVVKAPSTYTVSLTSSILTYNSPTSVTLADNAGSTANPSSHFVWGTNNYTAANAMRETLNALYPQGYEIFFPAGYYLIPVLDFPCGNIGTFGPSSVGNLTFTCTTATKNLTIRGASANSTTIENFKYDRGAATIGPGECSDSYYTCGLIRFGTHSSNNGSNTIPANWVNGVTISDLTLIDTKYGNGTFFNEPSVIDLQNTINDNVYNSNIQMSSYMCIFSDASVQQPVNVHDNSFYRCGWGGPAYSGTNAALNIFTPFAMVERNRVLYSGQCFEGAGPYEEFNFNFCELDDLHGNYPPGAGSNPVAVSPQGGVNVNSISAGVWNASIRNNVVINYSTGGGVFNGIGRMANMNVTGNLFINSNFELAGGQLYNGSTWTTGESTSFIFGNSTFAHNTFVYDQTFASSPTAGLLLDSRTEKWNVADTTVRVMGPPLNSIHNNAIYLQSTYAAWRPNQSYIMTTGSNSGSYVQPPMPNGFWYEAFGNGTGTSGATQPVWSTTSGATFTDGTVTWKTHVKPVHSITNFSLSFPNDPLTPNATYAITNVGMLSSDFTMTNVSGSGGTNDNGAGGPKGWLYDEPYAQFLVSGFPSGSWSLSENVTPLVGNQTTFEIVKNGLIYGSFDSFNSPNLGVLLTGHYYRLGQKVMKYILPGTGVSPGWIVTRSGWRGRSWTANQAYVYNDLVQSVADNGHLFAILDTAGCTSGAVEPVWNTGAGTTTTDNTCHWLESGADAAFLPLTATF